ncbi:hypothetical protein AAC387_Pa06g3183 [Persea americana]
MKWFWEIRPGEIKDEVSNLRNPHQTNLTHQQYIKPSLPSRSANTLLHKEEKIIKMTKFIFSTSKTNHLFLLTFAFQKLFWPPSGMNLARVSLLFKRETPSRADHSSLPLRTLSEVYPGTSFKPSSSSAVVVQDVEWKRCGIGDAKEADAPPRRRPLEPGTPRCFATLPKRDEQNTRDKAR